MTQHSTVHDTFFIEKNYKATPAQTFAAWADPDLKAKWFPKSEVFEFRIGGHEINRGAPPGGPVYLFDACYQDIVPNERIVYSYIMDMGETRISVSVTTVEFKPAAEGSGTRLLYTEQGVFLDGHDIPGQREHGTSLLLDKLGAALDELS